MPIGDFKLITDDIGWRGSEHSRLECVIAERDGTFWHSDDRGSPPLPRAPSGFAHLSCQWRQNHQ